MLRYHSYPNAMILAYGIHIYTDKQTNKQTDRSEGEVFGVSGRLYFAFKRTDKRTNGWMDLLVIITYYPWLRSIWLSRRL